MNVLFILFLIVDVLAALFLFRMAFMERSNMNSKYKRRLLLLTLLMITGLIIKKSNFTIACILVGLPASLLILFGIGMTIALMTHKGPMN